MLKIIYILYVGLKMTNLRFPLHLPGVNENELN